MQHVLPRELGDGLTLRRASAADAEALAAFNAEIHRDREANTPDASTAAWTRDLALRPHPTFSVEDFTVVEEQRGGTIVSTLNLIPQTWTYAGIPFGVGRVELVGTHRDYRGRGLVRAQMAVVHGWSAERGHLVQVIGGIPWFYRQFGYEMALSLGATRVGYKPAVPKLGEGKAEPFDVRPATAGDAPFIAEVHERAQQRYLVSCPRDAELWRYEIEGRSPECMVRAALYILEAGDRQFGYFALQPSLRHEAAALLNFELAPGVSWGLAAPAVARFVQAWGEGQGECGSQRWWLGEEHPAYVALSRFLVEKPRPYAYYLRVPDLPAFLRRIRPVLEQRLAASPFVGHSGVLRLGFFTSGVSLTLNTGRVEAIEPWQPSPGEIGDVTFPFLTFLQVLFGYRGLEEVEYAFPDCRNQGGESRALTETLFPKQASDIWAIV